MRAYPIVVVLLCAQSLAAQRDPRGRIFIERGCSECHAVSLLNIKAKTDAAPDLTSADLDVTIRYAVSLERFFDEPVGPMRLVLAAHVRLTRTDADSMARILRRLNVERLGELDIGVPRARRPT